MYNEINTKKYMIIPIYDTVVLPAVDMQMKIYDLTENEKSRIKIDGNKAVLLPLKEDAKPGERFQFFRNGYYIADTVLSKEGAPVFNQIVGLKSSFKLPV